MKISGWLAINLFFSQVSWGAAHFAKAVSPPAKKNRTAAETWDFPCDVPPRGKGVALELRGETHASAKDRDKKFEAQEKDLFARARRGEIILGLEAVDHTNPPLAIKGAVRRALGVFSEEAARNCSGIENEDSYLLSTLTDDMLGIWSKASFDLQKSEDIKIQRARALSQYSKLLYYSPTAQSAWKKIHRPLRETKLESLAKLLEFSIEKQDPDIVDVDILSGKNPEVRKDFVDLANSESSAKLIKIWDENIISEMETRTKQPSDLDTKALKFARDVIGDPDKCLENLDVVKEIVGTVVMKRRNEDWARNIGALYCRALAEKKPLFVLAGSSHINDLKERLEVMAHGYLKISAQTGEDSR